MNTKIVIANVNKSIKNKVDRPDCDSLVGGLVSFFFVIILLSQVHI